MTGKTRSRNAIVSSEIYEALTDDDAFGQLPSKIARAVRARSAVLQFADARGHASILAYSYFGENQVRDYQRNFVQHDLWANAAYSSPRNQNRAVILSRLVPNDVFERSAFRNDFFRAHHDDTFHCLGSGIALKHGFGLIGVHRGKREPEFEPKEESILNAALPHLRCLFSVRSAFMQAKAERSLANSTFDQLSTVALAISRDGDVLAAHPDKAEDFLSAAAGVGFRNGRLYVPHSFQAQWKRLLGKATAQGAPSGGVMLLGTNKTGKEPVWLEVSPAPTLPAPMCAIVVIRAASPRPHATQKRLQALFNLTAAEAVVAWLASHGETAEEIARTRSVSVSTVRAQIRNIFNKLECRSLAQLAMIVARLSR